MQYSDTRVANDGQAYPQEEFVEYYGARAESKWQNGTPAICGAQHASQPSDVDTESSAAQPAANDVSQKTPDAVPLHTSGRSSVDLVPKDVIQPNPDAVPFPSNSSSSAENVPNDVIQPAIGSAAQPVLFTWSDLMEFNRKKWNEMI